MTDSGKPLPVDWTECYLIGGGPSLHGFDFERLRGRTVVAINDAVLSIPWAPVLFSLDATWIRNRWEQIQQFAGTAYLAVADDVVLEHLPNIVPLIRVRSLRGLSDVFPRIHMGGGNSGFGAFNLAYLMGSRRIVLMGYDLCHSRTHWHEGYAWQGNGNDTMYRHWADQYKYTVPQLRRRGVRVFNASLDSQIAVFPKIPLSSVPLPLLEP